MKNPFDSQAFLQSVTQAPGVYRMLNADNTVLYVGKAKNLKNRLSSYFRGTQQSPKTTLLMTQVHHIEVTVTNTENEALILENTLIKRYKPRYNILFRDDKSYPYILLTEKDKFPRLSLYRGKKHAKGKYYGPFPSTGAARESLNILQKIFRIRQCDDNFFRNRSRPCLQYQIHRCTAPCVNFITPEAYQEDIRHAQLFLEGKDAKVVSELAAKMERASEALQFEQAARLRDEIVLLRTVQQQQHVIGEAGNLDAVVVLLQGGVICVEILFIRAGHLLGNKAYFPKSTGPVTEEEVLSEFLTQFYLSPENGSRIPQEILVSVLPEEKDWFIAALSEQAQRPIKIFIPQRGEKTHWMALAQKNAQAALEQFQSDKSSYYQRFEVLTDALGLDAIPQRLECFDISHTSGEATVASCVVFDTTGPLTKDYRRFNIQDITEGDDYAALYQAISRRYKRLKEGEGELPDLLIIDGGKGQLAQAEKVLEELQIDNVVLMSIAKGPSRKAGLEVLYLSGKPEGIHLPENSLGLHLIQHIRDEAHRFAITGHRQQRNKKRQVSVLEEIPGVGAKRRRVLLQQFGGLQGLSQASVEEISKTPGISKALAEEIHNRLHAT